MKIFLRIFAASIFLFVFFPLSSEEQKITVNSAQYTEYKKIPAMPATPDEEKTAAKQDIDDITDKPEEEKDEVIIFTGMVSISVTDASSVSTIKADKIIHNKTRNTLTAIGNVFYERKIDSSSGQSFKGEYLIFNIKKMEGVFLDGIIEQAATKKGKDPFRIHTEIAGKNESGTIAFKDALLTTSKEDDPLWSIRASRIWILPGNEMAFVNGFLSVGIVPVLYLPFFYHPADEMLFHPVFGYKNRQGAFVQTTTYLLGRKPLPKAEEGSSFSNFMQSDTLKKQKLEGLFFKNLDEPADNIGNSYLKILADAYSGLGYMIGLDGKFTPKNGYVRQIDFYSLFGISNTLYPMSGTDKNKKYTKYNSKGEINKNKSNLFGKTVPFRYDFNFGINMTKTPFSISLQLPLVSDPFFKKDFMGRSEDMNWFKYLLDKDKLAAVDGPSTETYYSWKLDGAIRPSFPKLQPWISSISLDAISGKLNFGTKTNTSLKGQDINNSPERLFFYPKNLTPELRGAISGSIFSTSMLNKSKTINKRKDLTGIKNPFDENFAAELKNELENKNSDEVKESAQEIKETNDNGLEDKDIGFISTFFSPVKIQNLKNNKLNHNIKYDLNYKFSGNFVEDLTFDYANWKTPEDIRWKNFFSNYYKLNGTAGLDSIFSYNQGLLNITNSFVLQGNYQTHSWVKDEKLKPSLQLNNFKLNLYSLTNTNTIKCSPLIFSPIFKPTYLEWTISETILQNKFSGTYDSPKWDTEKVKWKKEYIKTHAISTTLGFVINDYTQLFTSTINLPPLLQAYTFTGKLSFPYTKFNLSTRLFEKDVEKEKLTTNPKDLSKLKKWNWDPIKADLIFSFPYNITLSQYYTYNIADKKNDKYSIAFSWKYISTSYNMSREIPYKLNPSAGWEAKSTEKEFIPQSFGINISNSAEPLKFVFWKNRIQFQFNFSSMLNFNLIRITDSYFSFSTNMSFKVHEFLELSFSSTSRNDSIAKYFQEVAKLPIVIPGETNIFKDLASSFYFWDEQARRNSAFKLKSLDFNLTHYLKDWLLKFTYSVKPISIKEGAKTYYKLVPTITFMVQWNPISDIKIQTKQEETKDGKKFTVNRGEIK